MCDLRKLKFINNKIVFNNTVSLHFLAGASDELHLGLLIGIFGLKTLLKPANRDFPLKKPKHANWPFKNLLKPANWILKTC